MVRGCSSRQVPDSRPVPGWVEGQLLASCPQGTSRGLDQPPHSRGSRGQDSRAPLCPAQGAPGLGSTRQCLGDREPWRQSWRSMSWPGHFQAQRPRVELLWAEKQGGNMPPPRPL